MYYLSVLAILKNETMNLKMWIDHYLWQGVEHFYLIDNGSDDNPLDILKEYIDKNIVTYYYKPEKHKQLEHYQFVFDNAQLKNNTYWLIISDLDEFFYGVDKKLITKLKTLEFYNVIYCNWLMFGHENLQDHPIDIRTSIIHRENNINENTKYIFKPSKIHNSSQLWIHYLLDLHGNKIDNHPKVRIANNLIKLNHYPIQSLEFFIKVKMTRGAADTVTSDNIRNLTYFNNYNKNAIYKDTTLKNLIENCPEKY